MLSVMLIFLSAGLILIGISIPLVKRKVPLNSWFGIKLRNVAPDKETWYYINEKGGRLYLYFGIVLSFLSIALYFVPDITLVAYFIILSLFGCAGVIILSIRILKIGHNTVRKKKSR